MNYEETFNASYLRECRKGKGMSQYKLADVLGVTQGQIAQLETGVRQPSIGALRKLVKILDCDINKLLNL